MDKIKLDLEMASGGEEGDIFAWLAERNNQLINLLNGTVELGDKAWNVVKNLDRGGVQLKRGRSESTLHASSMVCPTRQELLIVAHKFVFRKRSYTDIYCVDEKGVFQRVDNYYY